VIIRLIFEPEPNVNVNHNKMFEFYSENYLSDFETEWGGYIVMNNFEKKFGKMEPCYQRYVKSSRGTQETLNRIIEYVRNNPMAGYVTHIYANPEGGNEVKIDIDNAFKNDYTNVYTRGEGI
jgi:ribosomal protein S17E